MPSLFSRARTTSTTGKKNFFTSDENSGLGPSDEFGRVSSRQSTRGGTLSPPSSKKDKKKDQKRSKTLPSGQDESEQLPESIFPDGAFLPLNLEKPRNDGGATEYLKEHDYGYLSYERHVVLGLEQVERLVEVISEELETRGGMTTPFIFSTTALDISSSAIKRLVQSFLNTCELISGQRAQEAEAKWREEARFAGPHELGMCLRWGLARVIRSVGGQDVRGLVSWEQYVEFRDSEAALGYPATHFATKFLPELVPPLQAVIIRLLSLLARLVANSTSSGHTPPTLSPLFGPLFFGLGPATLAFHHAYIHYLRAVNAMEHLILAFVRWQDTPRLSVSTTGVLNNPSASASSLGVPVRLKEWIKGYPAMLPLEQKKPQPRRGARTVRVLSVRRNVRMYSPDLVRTASTWAYRPPGSNIIKGLAGSKEWDRIAPATLKLAPRYSEGYKKRMDLPSNFHPDVAPGVGPGLRTSQSASSHMSATSSSSASPSLHPDPDYFGIGAREGEDRFRSLTDLKWGEFESMGFSGLGDEKKLQFDLTESARTERTAKRQTLSWNDFSSAGFSRMDAPLSATLQFSTPLANTISSWPAQNAEISKKLKKTQRALPAFGWDTEPVIGSEEVIEEAFIDVFCDLIYGGGWMDLERGEMLDRDCNWALVEYKSLPPSRTTASGGSDPRTATALLLFEEFVPLEYREQLAVKSSSRRRLPSLFSASGKRQWKQAPTLNGRPYIVGHVPHSPSYREVEFETLLHGTTSTKVLSFNAKSNTPTRVQSTISTAPTEYRPPVPVPMITKTPPLPLKPSESELQPGPRSEEMHSDSTASPSIKKSLFRLPTSPGSNRKSMIPAEYSTVEFQTRMASYSDDDESGTLDEPEDVKQKRRESSTDAWVDILVGSQSRRFGGQDAELPDRKRGPRTRHSDPDIASLEVAQVLASVRDRSPSPPSMMERVDQDYGMDQHDKDLDIDEVETVPRTSNARSDDTDESDAGGLPYDESLEHGNDISPPEIGALNARQMARHQRRVGYFDIHPERRKAATQSVIDEENIRAKLAKDESDEEDEDNDERLYGAPEVRPLPIPPVAAPVQPTIYEPSPLVPAKSTVSALNRSPEVKSDNFPAPPAPSNGQSGLPVTPSKTAALIEMYRERERGSSPKPTAPLNPVPIVIAPLAPSRLPIRTTSLQSSSPLPQVPLLTPSPKGSPNPSPPEPTLIDLPRIPLEETGRNSPARYQHGAPLHNVLEEEEE
ncbi:hypothetical protein GALMADRAFT_73169 [Galerina marginata CBS 339.88]|uniref:Meiotically up-regulated protein Msb1/Mug8 domain-containing protein n=1 Tax=Galerina marginata (strain CBS 339.88) TaxID=685588 RepID=A0A067SYV1_GALM3|nr:hypothetical protein GALMADRAFT_73169 [Galerina marginata CBS 339.88]